eukprot:764829-Hanusia_phi.AAC.1
MAGAGEQEKEGKVQSEVDPQMNKEKRLIQELWNQINTFLMNQKVAEEDKFSNEATANSDTENNDQEQKLDKKIIKFCEDVQKLSNVQLAFYCIIFFVIAYEQSDISSRKRSLKKGRFILEQLTKKYEDLSYQRFENLTDLIENTSLKNTKVFKNFFGEQKSNEQPFVF